MNLTHLGDALDHWKGSLFERLEQAGALHDFAVDPMATDADAWRAAELAAYAQLLHVKTGQILLHRAPVWDRQSYFGEIDHSGDLFLDPDTGIWTKRRASERHVASKEVAALVASSPRVVAVYQHSAHNKISAQVDQSADAVCRVNGARAHWCTYETPLVAMLFFSRDKTRIERIAKTFRKFLGTHAGRRIRP